MTSTTLVAASIMISLFACKERHSLSVLAAAEPTPAVGAQCQTGDANDVMMRVGPWCIDKYEATVCDGSKTGPDFAASCISDDNHNNGQIATIDETGNQLLNVIDRQGVIRSAGYRAYAKVDSMPTRYVNYYEAVAACANAGKQLLSDSAWVTAALGTVDPGPNDGTENALCNTSNTKTPGVRRTGQAGVTPAGADSCISQWGVEDLIGNLYEWTDVPATFGATMNDAAYTLRINAVLLKVGATDPNHGNTGFRCMRLFKLQG